MGTPQSLYLSSLESVRFESVRECELVDLLVFDTGKVAAVAGLKPGVPGQDFGVVEDIERVILSTRHEGVSIDEIDKFPCFVFIAIPGGGREMLSSLIRKDDLQIIGWGELYRSADDARNHKFD
jgi:hypothetical protein